VAKQASNMSAVFTRRRSLVRILRRPLATKSVALPQKLWQIQPGRYLLAFEISAISAELEMRLADGFYEFANVVEPANTDNVITSL